MEKFELKQFDFRDDNFQKKYTQYLDGIDEFVRSQCEIHEDGSWTVPYELAEWQDYAKLLHHQFPQFLKDFLAELSKSRFYKKHADRALAGNRFTDERYIAFDWHTCGDRLDSKKTTLENLLYNYCSFGDIAFYEGDAEVTINIDWRRDEAWIERGWAVGLYGSKKIIKQYPIPKYLQPLIDKLFADWKDWAGPTVFVK